MHHLYHSMDMSVISVFRKGGEAESSMVAGGQRGEAGRGLSSVSRLHPPRRAPPASWSTSSSRKEQRREGGEEGWGGKTEGKDGGRKRARKREGGKEGRKEGGKG